MDIMRTEIAAHKSNLLFDLSDQLFDIATIKCNSFSQN